MKNNLLLCDFGGTHIRIAKCNINDNDVTQSEKLVADDFKGPIDAIEYLVKKSNFNIKYSVIAAAGPKDVGKLQMTNRDWLFEIDKIKSHFKIKNLHLINDFEAAAFAYPKLSKNDNEIIAGDGDFKFKAGRNLVIGAGTGFGCAIVFVDENNKVNVFPTEFGLSLCGALQFIDPKLKEILQKKLKAVIIEDLLSGDGIELIYNSICEWLGVEPKFTTSEEIVSNYSDEIATKSLDFFQNILAITIADLVTCFNISGDIYLAGGLMRALSAYTKKFDLKEKMLLIGRNKKLIAKKTIYLTTKPHIGLFGGLVCAKQTFLS